MPDKKSFLFQPLPKLVAICASPLVLIRLCHYLAVAPIGTDLLLSVSLCIVFPILGAVPALVIAPFFLFGRRFRAMPFG